MNFKNYLLALSLITPACFAFDASDVTVRPHGQATDGGELDEVELEKEMGELEKESQRYTNIEKTILSVDDDKADDAYGALHYWNEPAYEKHPILTIKLSHYKTIGFVYVVDGTICFYMSDEYAPIAIPSVISYLSKNDASARRYICYTFTDAQRKTLNKLNGHDFGCYLDAPGCMVLHINEQCNCADNFSNRARHIFYREPIPGIAVRGKIMKCIKSGRSMLSLYDAKGTCLWYVNCKHKDKTLKSLKAFCPSCIDTTQLTYIRDYTAQGAWNRWFGKKITQ